MSRARPRLRALRPLRWRCWRPSGRSGVCDGARPRAALALGGLAGCPLRRDRRRLPASGRACHAPAGARRARTRGPRDRRSRAARSRGGRSIQLTLGRGSEKVLLWSQMHGDEPSATPALLDLADYLLANARRPRDRAAARAADAAYRADAQPGRRRGLHPPQRPGDRHQPRRAQPHDAGRHGCSSGCATSTRRSSASTCTTRTAPAAGGRHTACWRRGRCWRWWATRRRR